MIALRDRSDGDRGDRRNRVGLGDRKDREKTVTDEFQDFAAIPADFCGLSLEQRDRECRTATAYSIVPSRSPFASEHAPAGA